ncbi:MAG: cobalt-precorrin-6A reductase [Nitratireductor sp.]
MALQTKKILILGGTKEAAELAKELCKKGHDVTTSLAGRTKEPKPLEGKVRIGGFSSASQTGVLGLAEYIEDECFDLVIDATHPFAKQISENAKIATNLSGTELEIKTRQPWKRVTGDIWIEVANLEEAKSVIPQNANILLALGSKYIDIFEDCLNTHFLVRMVDEPQYPLRLPKHTLILGRPFIDVSREKEMLVENNITHIICRNSGGEGAYAKIIAARELGMPVIIVSR